MPTKPPGPGYELWLIWSEDQDESDAAKIWVHKMHGGVGDDNVAGIAQQDYEKDFWDGVSKKTFYAKKEGTDQVFAYTAVTNTRVYVTAYKK